MKQRPILFSGAMVRALLDGSKTQTRRIVKKQPFERPGKHDHRMGYVSGRAEKGDEIDGFYAHTTCAGGEWQAKCPYGQPGDQLWVRETWNWFDPETILADRRGNRAPFTGAQGARSIEWVAAYAADGNLPYPGYNGANHWRPSIHMPRWASRIQLEITGIRMERLQDISEEDAVAEGIGLTQAAIGVPMTRPDHMPMPIFMYKCLWESLNGPGSWDANPWVWVIEFKRVKP